MAGNGADEATRWPVRRERGQLIVIGGLTLAVVLVALALLLNSAIYTQNLATRADLDTAEVIEHRAAAIDGAAGAMRLANYGIEDGTYAERDTAVVSNLSTWETLQRRFHVADGAVLRTGVQSTTEGARVTQRSAGPLNPANPDLLYQLEPLGLTGQTWLVAKGVEAREYRLTLQRDSMSAGDVDGVLDLLDETVESALDPEEMFSVHVEDESGDQWRLFVYRSADDTSRVNVSVVANTDGTWDHAGTCSQATATIQVDLGRGTVSGDEGVEECRALPGSPELDPPYDVYYVNGDDATGTYSFIVNEIESTFRDDVEAENDGLLDAADEVLVDGLLVTDVTGSDTYHDAPTDDGPYTTTAVYETRIDVYYRTNRIAYDTTVRVAPDELPDD